jgi:hypothetical protein
MAESIDDLLVDRHTAHLESNDLGIRVARHIEAPADIYGTRMRTFDGFVDINVLETYTASSQNSPLNDAQTAAVFWHFVHVTGSSMSLYERHPFDPSPMFQGEPVPKARQHIWTCMFQQHFFSRGILRLTSPTDTFPIMAFNHPALLQAILALASLQIAKLQSVPPMASMKHYHLALRRLSKNYQSPSRRTQPATLAATLLLGFYEVWNSDHDKWCKHMWGARAILKEIPLKDITKDVLAFKRKRRQMLQELRHKREHDGPHQTRDEFADHGETHEINTDILSQISGRPVSYDEGGQARSNDTRPQASRCTERDVVTFEHLSDLYWWYCKMDVYQSILGGTRLL